MDVFTWSSKIDELQPQKWGKIYRQYLHEGFSLENAYSKLYTSINDICQDFGVSPKDNHWTLLINIQTVQMYNKITDETRFENGSYVS